MMKINKNENIMRQVTDQVKKLKKEYDGFYKTVRVENGIVIPEDWEKCRDYIDSIDAILQETAENYIRDFTNDEIYKYIKIYDILSEDSRKKTYVTCLDELLKRDKNNTRALIKKTEFLSAYGKYSKAITLCNRLIKINPDNDKAHYFKGQNILYQVEYKVKRQETIDGLHCINRAIELNPDDPEYWDVKEAYLSAFKTSEEYDSKIHLRGAFLEFYNDYDQLLNDLAYCYQRMIDLDIKTIGKKNYKGPLAATGVSLYCYLLEDLGRNEESLKYLDLQEKMEFIDEEENISENNFRRSILCERLGRFDEALKFLQSYIDYSEKNDTSGFNVYRYFDEARLLRITGNEDRAIEIFEEKYAQYLDEYEKDLTVEYYFLESIGLYDEALKTFNILYKDKSEKFEINREKEIIEKSRKKEYRMSNSWEKRVKKSFDFDKFEISQPDSSKSEEMPPFFKKLSDNLNKFREGIKMESEKYGLSVEDYKFVSSFANNSIPEISIPDCMELFTRPLDPDDYFEEQETIIIDGSFISLNLYKKISQKEMALDFSFLKKMKVLDISYSYLKDIKIENTSLEKLVCRSFVRNARLDITNCPNLVEIVHSEDLTIVCNEQQKKEFFPRKRKNIEVQKAVPT